METEMKRLVGVWLSVGAFVMALSGVGVREATAVPIPTTGYATSDFSGWTGVLNSDVVSEVPIETAEILYPSNFNRTTGVKLINDDTSYGVGLYKEFTLATTGNWRLSFNYEWMPTDDRVKSQFVPDPYQYYDFMQVSLQVLPVGSSIPENVVGGNYVTMPQLYAGSTATVGLDQYLGADIRLMFYIEDGDFVTGDILKLSNFSITEQVVVPEPTSIVLVAAGLVLLGAVQRRKFFR